MNFELTEEHLMVQQMARDFAENELKPGVIERDREQYFPPELLRRMGELGLLGMMTDPAYNGGGMDTISYILAMEEVAKWDASAAVIMSVNNSLVCWGLEHYGTEAQKAKYLSRLTTGERIGAFCLSEPEAGSDATRQRTTAIDQGDHYLLTGTKNWITNAGIADIYLVMAQTNREAGHRGINCLIVERGMQGFELGPKEDKLGIRGSDTHSLNFNEVKVPKENRVGPDGFGFKFAMNTLNGGRIGIAAQALGIAQGAYNLAAAYAKQRKAFGTEIINHQAIQFKLANMATEIEAARLLIYKAGRDKDEGRDYVKSAAMAKLYASRTAMYCADEAIQIHGGNGYVKEYHVERMLRDAKITEIYEGTSEIQRLVIARQLAR
ncbi:MAG: acyl-CoA dehydrogenase [Bacteroidetes bacterium]|nr:MAG: acyl-CoA dehydrogenase [Bacteroidota bacterium]